jgi:ATP-dependent 26S proteasome regulatory subunit
MEEHPLQVARCTKIILMDPKLAEAARAVNPPGAAQGQKGADEQDKYVINIKQIAKFVVGLGERVAPTDIEEGMRVGSVFSTPLNVLLIVKLALIVQSIKSRYHFHQKSTPR